MAGVMTAPFYRSLGFDRNAIAVANFIPSLAATFAGTAIGAWLVARLGVGRALVADRLGADRRDGDVRGARLLGGRGACAVWHGIHRAFAEGMADAAFITYLSGLCR